MMIDGISLPDDFERIDPYYTGFVINKQYAGSGALLVELAQQQAGQPITLNSGEHWVTKAQVDALLAHAMQGLQSFSITLPDSTVHNVMWDYSNEPLTAEPLIRETYPTASSYMINVQLKFLTV